MGLWCLKFDKRLGEMGSLDYDGVRVEVPNALTHLLRNRLVFILAGALFYSTVTF